MNLSFRNPRGTIGVGSGPGAMEPELRGPAPFNCRRSGGQRRTARGKEKTNSFFDNFDDLRRLNRISHRRRRKVGDPSEEVWIEFVVVHMLSDPGFDHIRNSAISSQFLFPDIVVTRTDLARIGRSFLVSQIFISSSTSPIGGSTWKR